MEMEELKGIFAKILTDIAYLMIEMKQDAETAFITTRDSIHMQTGMSLKDSANITRLALGIYMGDEKYAEGSLAALEG